MKGIIDKCGCMGMLHFALLYLDCEFEILHNVPMHYPRFPLYRQTDNSETVSTAVGSWLCLC